MLNFGASKPRVKGGPRPPGLSLDPLLVPAQGEGVYLPRGVCIPACIWIDTPNPPVDRQTPVKT